MKVKRLYKTLILTILVAVIFTGIPVQAESGNSFTRFQTYSEEITIRGRDMYEAKQEITATTLGISKKMDGITDLYARDGKLYILCGDTADIYVLNKEYQLEYRVEVSDESGEPMDFQGAQGIYVDEGGQLYIADTEHARILICNEQGQRIRTLELPDSDVIPDDFIFQPKAIVQDDDDNYYVVSAGSYYGALFFDSQYEFQGFYGANTVQYTVLDVFSNLWNLLTGTDEKRSKSVRTLPYAFGDIAVDEEGYIYTCTGAVTSFTDNNGEGQIQRLGPGGENTLLKRDNYGKSVSASAVNFLEDYVVSTWEKNRVQNLVSIAINEDEFVFALDSTYGIVYVYDQDCNLVTTFGGGVEQGQQLGMFTNATTMTLFEDDVLVADSTLGNVTVFKMNEYGKKVAHAIGLYHAGDYQEAEPLWREILKMDSNNMYAYRGLARAAYTQGNYEEALKYAEQSCDYVVYDMAFQQVRNELVEKYFPLVFAGLLIIITLLVIFLLKMRKREEPLIKNVKWREFFHAQVHPFTAFAEMKYWKTGSLKIAIGMIILYVITSIVRLTNSSFLFRSTDVYSYNSLYTLGSTAGIVVLWIVANWLVSSILIGKGTLKDVAISAGYSVFPMIVGNILITVLSYILTYDDVTFINAISLVATIYMLLLMCVSNMTTHEFSFGKFILATIVTIFMMILVVFILFMLVIMLQQFGNFIYTIYMEVAYR